jgi:drug/metabolite transporter (DMT)-like permease
LGIIFSLAIEAPWLLPLPSTTTILAVAAMGVLGSALAALCNFTIVQRAGAMNAMLVTIILPVTPVLLGAVFLGERLTAQEIVGAGIIAAALLVIDGRLLRSSADDA